MGFSKISVLVYIMPRKNFSDNDIKPRKGIDNSIRVKCYLHKKLKQMKTREKSKSVLAPVFDVLTCHFIVNHNLLTISLKG